MSQERLFGGGKTYGSEGSQPMANAVRPKSWEEYQGADRIDPAIRKLLQSAKGAPPSLIFWGPPGCGKTTLARLIGDTFDCTFVEFSAVLAGVKDVRAIVAQAERAHKPTVLFVDEIHRFNKAQQDAFLPHVERGTIVLLGATTENPSFSLNAALLSRCPVVALDPLSEQDLQKVLDNVLQRKNVRSEEAGARLLIQFAAGDARKLLNAVEGICRSEGIAAGGTLKELNVRSYLQSNKTLHYDRSGEEHYNVASAFIKSLRGSSPDAALYWGFRMIESGEDPRFVFRRLIIFASEDIGNADPRALSLAVSAAEAYDRLGMPEGRIPLAQCITYLATAPKSNRSYIAVDRIIEHLRQHPAEGVPLHLRNAPTKLMKELSYGANYEYPHDSPDGYAPGVQYVPKSLQNATFYTPVNRGYESRILERMRAHKERDAQANNRRQQD